MADTYFAFWVLITIHWVGKAFLNSVPCCATAGSRVARFGLCQIFFKIRSVGDYSRILETFAVLSKNTNEASSCGFSMVAMQETTESLPTTDTAGFWELREFWPDDLVLRTLVVSLRVIVPSEFSHSTTQGGLSEEDHSLHAGFFDAPNEPLSVGVPIRTSRGKSQRLDSGALHELPELLGENCRAVVDQEPDAAKCTSRVIKRRKKRT